MNRVLNILVFSVAVFFTVSFTFAVEVESFSCIDVGLGNSAGQIRNTSSTQNTIGSVKMYFYTGSVSSGACTGFSLGSASAYSNGSLAFPQNCYIHISSRSAYTLAQANILGSATLVTCIKMVVTTGNNGTGYELTSSGKDPAFNVVCANNNCISTSATIDIN